jgi:hypothetical protein
MGRRFRSRIAPLPWDPIPFLRHSSYGALCQSPPLPAWREWQKASCWLDPRSRVGMKPPANLERCLHRRGRALQAEEKISRAAPWPQSMDRERAHPDHVGMRRHFLIQNRETVPRDFLFPLSLWYLDNYVDGPLAFHDNRPIRFTLPQVVGTSLCNRVECWRR